MPKDAARKSIIREFMRETGLRYTAARRELDEPPGPPFDPGWLNLEITLRSAVATPCTGCCATR